MSSQPTAHAPTGTHEHGQPHIHVVPKRVLLAVFAALLFFTFLTVSVTWVDFGRTINVWLALGVAVAKATLVALFFMHLRWDSPFNSLVLVSALFFVALFIGTVILDSKEYQINMVPPTATSANP